MPTHSATAQTQPSLMGLFSRRYELFARTTPSTTAGGCVREAEVFIAGAAVAEVYMAGSAKSEVYVAGPSEAEVSDC